LIAVNLKGVFLCSRAVLPAMIKAQRGSIVNIASLLGLRGHYPGFPCANVNYAAAKAGVDGMTRQLAAEYAADGIRVNAICPGWHEGTALGRERKAVAPEEVARFDEAIYRRVPMGRKGQPEELDGLIVYLASDASSYVTGQSFSHDGGWTAV